MVSDQYTIQDTRMVTTRSLSPRATSVLHARIQGWHLQHGAGKRSEDILHSDLVEHPAFDRRDVPLIIGEEHICKGADMLETTVMLVISLHSPAAFQGQSVGFLDL